LLIDVHAALLGTSRRGEKNVPRVVSRETTRLPECVRIYAIGVVGAGRVEMAGVEINDCRGIIAGTRKTPSHSSWSSDREEKGEGGIVQEKTRVKRNERGGMHASVCAFCVYVCVSEGRKREEGWVVTPWKSGDNASALNPPSFRREGRMRMGEGMEIRGERRGSSSDLSVREYSGMLCKI